MRLVKLTSSHRSFKTIRFNPFGLTLIVGDSSADRQEGSSNGVGKTLALKLVHHCLGARLDNRLKTALPDWLFFLEFTIDNKPHIIERSADGKRLAFDEKSISQNRLIEWLDESNIFRLDPELQGITFRSLFTRFGRRLVEDCVDPVVTYKETEYYGLLRSLYLMGADCELVIAKKKNKNLLDELKKSQKDWKKDHVLHEMFMTSGQPKVRAEWLDKEIPRIKALLNRFRVNVIDLRVARWR
ncbi:MAG: hypothetical protein HY788_06240 [Deltaproteobacteria bacterium]|nr:hypothetical protein [Deltaproteobacteria bacterium]